MKNKLQNSRLYPVLLAFVLVACSTQKNTFVNRNMHNLTAHYNVYFNGNEALKAGLLKVEDDLDDDYTKILPIYKESLPAAKDMVSSDMDIAIEKGTKLIKYHSITKPPKQKHKSSRKKKPIKNEYNKWVDDAYFLMGKAYLYKKDYFRANATFNLILRKYKEDPIIKYKAYLWLARTLTEEERYTEAAEIISSLEGDNKFPEKLAGELAITTADLHLKQNQYEGAIAYLNIGIKEIKGNKRKTRYSYILAQLYQETKNNALALKTYHQVVRRRPDYEMLFNARINSAKVFSGEGNIADLKKELNNMRKKSRNQPYLDQIYYALGNISYNEGKIPESISLYKKSVTVSTNNNYQRALSCFTLADILFSQKEYIPSGKYYDSAMAVIDENYPNYQEIVRKYNSLDRLVKNLICVETEDSLQRLANMSEVDRNKLVSKWIEEAKKKAELEASADEIEYSGSTYRSSKSSTSSSSWYFYNTSTTSYGKKEFQRVWGTRKNEDNWRRSDKGVTEIDDKGEPVEASLEEVAKAEEAKRDDDPTTRDYYLQDIPLTDSLMMASHNKIRDALYSAGNLFKADFNDLDHSIGCFTDLNRRYPKNIYLLPSYYNLYDLYKTVGKIDSANYYRELILKDYPESNYAKFLLNPNYFIELEAINDKIEKLYGQAFSLYKYRDFNKAAQMAKQAMTLNPDSLLLPKIDFIRMVSESRLLAQGQFSDSLSRHMRLYPKTETAQLASEIQNLLKDDKLKDYDELVKTGYLTDVIKNLETKPANSAQAQSASEKWNKEQNLLHYFVIAVPNDEEINVNRLKFDIANYNIDHFTSRDFDIETDNLNNNTKLIVVRNFDNKESAMIYFLSIIRKPEVFKSLAGKKFLTFIISSNNYREMLSDRGYDEYLQFFVQNYSNYTTGNFSEKDLETPEALIAKLNDNGEELKEQGQFVMVKTADSTYKAPVVQETYTLDYNAPHILMVLIKKDGFRTAYLMRSLVQFNSINYRNMRLRVSPENITEGSLLIISPFAGGVDAKKYLDNIAGQKELFSSLKDIPYELLLITPKNLETLQKTGKQQEYLDFYKKNYVIKKIPTSQASTTGTKASEDKTAEMATPSSTKTEQQPATVPATATTEKPVEKAPVAEISKEEVKTETSTTSPQEADKQTTVVQATADTVKTQQKEVTSTLFSADSKAAHNYIILVPTSGYNSNLLVSYLKRFNAISYRSLPLQTITKSFSNTMSMIQVTGLSDETLAKEYIQSVSKDQRIIMSLKNINYKNFIITNSNLKVLEEKKNVDEYQSFHTKAYNL